MQTTLVNSSSLARVSRTQRYDVRYLAVTAALLGCAASADGPNGSGAGSGGSPVILGGSGSTSLGGGGTNAPVTGGNGASGVGVRGTGGTTPPVGGGAGAIAGGGRSGGGSGTTAATGGAGGSIGAGGTTSYPMLDGAMIGTPAAVPINVTPALVLAESPLWDPCGHQLLFVDVQASAIYALKDGAVSTFAMNTGNANGIAWDIDGSLILAQMGGNPGHLARRDKAGTIKVIEPAGGPALHTPDDVVVRSDGTIYFSDGDFAPVSTNLLGASAQLPVYILKPGGTMLINGGMVSGPNGIELSPDEKTLYVDGYGEGSVWSFNVAADGTITKTGAALATGLTNPDSLCLDAAGNLYVGVSTGLQVLRPDGTKVKLIPFMGTMATFGATPGATNCTFGGDDGKTLYITAWNMVGKVDGMPIPGLDWVVSQKRVKCN